MSTDQDSFAALFETSGAEARGTRRPRRGDRVEARVVAIGRDAVFVDLGGKQEGYIERSELAAKDGSLPVEVGQTISSVVSQADGERVRLQPLFVRQSSAGFVDDGGELVAIPRARSGPLLVEGAQVRGSVTGVERYGLFVQIEGTTGRAGRGLIPTAETATPRGADLHKLFPVGTIVDAKVVAIAEDGKIRLSIKALTADAERRDYEAYAKEQRVEEDAAGATERDGSRPKAPSGKSPKAAPAPRNFGTLGDLLTRAGATASAVSPKPATSAREGTKPTRR
jgi:small subunit ribosomal protein S1